MTPAKQAAAEIAETFIYHIPGATDATRNQYIAEHETIISRAILQEVAPLQAVIDARGKEITRLLSAQRSYVEWIDKHARHIRSCPCSMYYRHEVESGETPDCTCGLSKLRNELRKQVGGEYMIQRYTYHHCDGMHKEDDGGYVEYSDYSSLQAKHDRLAKALESIASCPEEDISDQTVYVMLGIARSALLADEVTDESGSGK